MSSPACFYFPTYLTMIAICFISSSAGNVQDGTCDTKMFKHQVYGAEFHLTHSDKVLEVKHLTLSVDHCADFCLGLTHCNAYEYNYRKSEGFYNGDCILLYLAQGTSTTLYDRPCLHDNHKCSVSSKLPKNKLDIIGEDSCGE